MEGDLSSETQRRPPPTVAGNIDCSLHLTRSNSDASSLTAENCKDFSRRSENKTPDECTAWTNEKHNSYLYHLEMSFVEQLNQSKSVLAHCSGPNLRDINIYRKWLINVNNAPAQYDVLLNGCWQKVDCAVGEPISSSTSADSHASLESKRTYHSKPRGMHCHPSPAKMPTLLKLIGTSKQGKGVISHGIQTCPQESSSSNRSNGDSIDLTREGTGQNFLDEDNQSTLNFESQAKRLKIASGDDGSHHDQIVPSREFLTSNYSVINGSTCGEQLARCESVSKF